MILLVKSAVKGDTLLLEQKFTLKMDFYKRIDTIVQLLIVLLTLLGNVMIFDFWLTPLTPAKTGTVVVYWIATIGMGSICFIILYMLFYSLRKIKMLFKRPLKSKLIHDSLISLHGCGDFRYKYSALNT